MVYCGTCWLAVTVRITERRIRLWSRVLGPVTRPA
jgi:hypothetical protein